MRRPGPKTIYALSAVAAVLLVSAAALAASGIDIGRPKTTDLPVLVARSEPSTASVPVAPITVTPPPAAPAAPVGQTPAVSDEGGSSLGSSKHAPVSAAAPAAATPAPPATGHDHEVVTPPVRENDEHRTTPQSVSPPAQHD